MLSRVVREIEDSSLVCMTYLIVLLFRCLKLLLSIPLSVVYRSLLPLVIVLAIVRIQLKLRLLSNTGCHMPDINRM